MRAILGLIRAWFTVLWERYFTTPPEVIPDLECFILSYHVETLQSAAYSSDRLREQKGRWRLPTVAELSHISGELARRIAEGDLDCDRPEHVYVWAFDMREAAFVGYCPFLKAGPGSVVIPDLGYTAADEEALDSMEEGGEGWLQRRRKAGISRFYAVSVREIQENHPLRRSEDR